MKILLIGNFSLPYEEENLHNLTLFNQLKEDNHKCSVINIGEMPSEDNEIVNAKNYIGFIIKLLFYGIKSNVIHFLTKGYTRPGLMKLVTAVVIGKIFLKRIIITLHPEMFSIFGQLRSKMGGQQLLHLSFSLADKIICGDRHTSEVALSHYSMKGKFEIIPAFFHVPDGTGDAVEALKKLKDKKRVIVFSGVGYPSLIFDILQEMLAKYLDKDTGLVIYLAEEKPEQLKHVIEEIRRFPDMVFINFADKQAISMAYARADFVVRPLSCDGKPLFNNIAVMIKRPLCQKSYAYFPLSLALIKEGNASDLCAYISNKILMEKSEIVTEPVTEDFFKKVKEIYLSGDKWIASVFPAVYRRVKRANMIKNNSLH